MDGVEYRFECAWYTWEFVRFVSYEGAVIIELTKEADSMKNRIIDAEETSLCYADDKETVKRLFED